MQPDNWAIAADQSSSFLTNWVNAHMEATKALNKPMVFEEFGKNATNPFDPTDSQERTKYFSEVFDAFTTSLEADDAMRGVQYWMWDVALIDQTSSGFEDFGQDQVPTDGRLFQEVIVPAAQAAAQHTGTVAGCAPTAAAEPAPPAPAGGAVPPPEGPAVPAPWEPAAPETPSASGRKLLGKM